MLDTMDDRQATELLARLMPELALHERELRAGSPTMDDDAVQEGALEAALRRIGEAVSRRTFVYLRWRLERTRRMARTAPAAPTLPEMPTPVPSTPGMRAADDARIAAEASVLRVPRLMCDDAGDRWVVCEVGPPDALGRPGAGCLVFAQARVHRRLTAYPADWRLLSNEALGALLPPA